MRPNPSIERTSTGLARFTPLVYVPLRGPSRWRPAHVNVRPHVNQILVNAAFPAQSCKCEVKQALASIGLCFAEKQ